MPVLKYLPSAIALAWMAVTPALADDLFAAPPSTGWYNNLFSKEPVSPPGTPKYADWRGLYAGGQVSYSSGHGDFSGATSSPIGNSLRETEVEENYTPSAWPVLGTTDHGAPGFGGFVGYNFEYLTPEMNVVLGFEANYDWANLNLVAPSFPLSRFESGDADTVSITAAGTASNLDFATLRGRVGWGIDRFLPYAFVGFALGNASIHISETTKLVQTSPPGTFLFPATAGKDSAWLYGMTAGVGLDVAVSPNFFVRAEYEYVQFQSLDGVALDLNTVRLGGGVRF
jgi:opacity protein-like surface antigen